MSIELLRRLPLFAGVPDEDLFRLCQMANPLTVKAGDVLMEEGSAGDALYIVIDGEFEISKRAGKEEIVIATRGPGEVLGEMSLLGQIPRTATVRALYDSRLYVVTYAAFQELITSSAKAALGILHTVASRLQHTEAMLMQHEKMAALGTLAAGLAHELNNPAAAVKRSAAQLRGTLAQWQQVAAVLNTQPFTDEQKQRINQLRQEMATRAAAHAELNPLERSDREGEVQAWLEDRGVDMAWELAPPLVTMGWTTASLTEAVAGFPPEQAAIIARWLAIGYNTYQLLDEVGQSSERISEIVRAVKTYSYLDQAPIQEVNVHDGLENTLIIMRYKLKHGVTVRREYAENLPRIEAYASELNQVWTNIIDNAVDAMEGKGVLTLRTQEAPRHVVVTICDTGPGIPPEVQPRIFEPFFTTKEPGQGTGMGLDIAYNIVVHKHRGQISFTSRPGETCFQVMLPLQLQRSQRGGASQP